MICDRLVFPFLDQTLLLLCQKAIYWEEEKALIAADVHLGKGGHFRKAGIAVPRELAQDDLAVLSDLIREHHPEKLIFWAIYFIAISIPIGIGLHCGANNSPNWRSS